jgi:cytidylate kinase
MSAPSEFHLADRRLTEWFLREQAVREGRSKLPQTRFPVMITISRQFGAGGHTVAEAIVESLGTPWAVWDRAIIDRVAESAHVQKRMVDALDEHARNWVDGIIRVSMGLGMMEEVTFRKHLALVLGSLAQQGHIITIGRGANFVLPTALNVRLMADIETRAQAIMALENVDHATALKRIQQVDKERADYTRTIFSRDINDPAAYSLVINTSDLDIAGAIQAIVTVARQRFECAGTAPHA